MPPCPVPGRWVLDEIAGELARKVEAPRWLTVLAAANAGGLFPRHWTTTEAARRLGLSKTYTRTVLKAAGVHPSSPGRYRPLDVEEVWWRREQGGRWVDRSWLRGLPGLVERDRP